MKPGDRVVQIPAAGPMRYGVISEVSQDGSVAIMWDNNVSGASDWYDFDQLESIWRVADVINEAG